MILNGILKLSYSLAMSENRHDRRLYKATHRHLARGPRTRFQKLGFTLVGLMFIGFGLRALLNGRLHYTNWWGLPVFAPYAIIVAILVLAIACYGAWERRS